MKPETPRHQASSSNLLGCLIFISCKPKVSFATIANWFLIIMQ